MKILSVVLFTAIAFGACDDGNYPGINKKWLSKTIAEIEADTSATSYQYIVRAEYEDQCVVYVESCCDLCNNSGPIYRCNGTLLENADITKIKNRTIIWQPGNSGCFFPSTTY